jgi:hypothetical protein
MKPNHQHVHELMEVFGDLPNAQRLEAYLWRSHVGVVTLRAIMRNWGQGFATKVQYVQHCYQGLYSVSTVAHVFVKLADLRVIARTGGGHAYRPSVVPREFTLGRAG